MTSWVSHNLNNHLLRESGESVTSFGIKIIKPHPLSLKSLPFSIHSQVRAGINVQSVLIGESSQNGWVKCSRGVKIVPDLKFDDVQGESSLLLVQLNSEGIMAG